MQVELGMKIEETALPGVLVLTPQRLQETFGVRAHYLTDPFDGAQILRFHS